MDCPLVTTAPSELRILVRRMEHQIGSLDALYNRHRSLDTQIIRLLCIHRRRNTDRSRDVPVSLRRLDHGAGVGIVRWQCARTVKVERASASRGLGRDGGRMVDFLDGGGAVGAHLAGCDVEGFVAEHEALWFFLVYLAS